MDVKKKERRLLFLCWLVYTVAYLGRYSVNANIGLIMDAYAVTRTEAGLITTCFFFAYGAGQFLNGVLARCYPKRWLFPVALCISAGLNLAVFFGVPFPALKYLWALNGLVQSCLWPAIVDIIGSQFDEYYSQKSVLVMSTTIAIGTLIIYGCSALFVQYLNYRFSFLLGALAMLAAGTLWLCLYSPVPLPCKAAMPGQEASHAKKKLTAAILLMLAMLAAVAVFDNFVKDGLQTWVPVILRDLYKIPDSSSILLTLVLPLMGIGGASTAVALNRRIRQPIALCAVFCAASFLCILGILFLKSYSIWIVLAFFAAVILLMHAINNVVTIMTPLFLRDSVDSGKMAGILNGCCYVGSTVSTVCLGRIADASGWNAVFLTLLGCMGLGVLLCCAYLLLQGRKSY